jgi:Tfp pilus assembly protein PilO
MTPVFSRAAWTRPYTWPFLALFGFNVLVFLAFTLPRSIQERRTAAEALVLRKDLDARRTEMAAVRTRAQTVKANVAETSRFYREAVPPCVGHSHDLLRELTANTRQTGILSERISTALKELNDVPLTEIAITVPVGGTYQQVGSFLQKLERSPHFLVVESVQIKERDRAGGGADLSIKLNAYCHVSGPRIRRGPVRR